MRPLRCVVDLQVLQVGHGKSDFAQQCLELSHALLQELDAESTWLLVHGLDPESVEFVRSQFDGYISQEHIKVFECAGPILFSSGANDWRILAAERVREYTAALLKPDLVFAPDPFYGFHESMVTTRGRTFDWLPSAVTACGITALARTSLNLADPRARLWHSQKLEALTVADLVVATSEFSRQNAINRLGLNPERVVVAGRGLSPTFRAPDSGSSREVGASLPRGILPPFVLYVENLNSRASTASVIAGFAKLPNGLRKHPHLVIVSDRAQSDMATIAGYCRSAGLSKEQFTVISCRTREELASFYRLCTLAVVAENQADFAITALEAISFGAATVGANAGSIPEILQCPEALFDLDDPSTLGKKLEEVLTSEQLCVSLRESGLKRAEEFTWKATARRMRAAFEEAVECKRAASRSGGDKWGPERPTLAFVLHWPSDAEVTKGLIELWSELTGYYELEIVAISGSINDPWVVANYRVRDDRYFLDQSWKYDRILYLLEDSPESYPIFTMLARQPGVVVLKSFFVGHMLGAVEPGGISPDSFLEELFDSHGYDALLYEAREGRKAAISKYPCNRRVLDRAAGVIVPAHQLREMAESWYGAGAATNCLVVPQVMLRQRPHKRDESTGERTSANAFLVCCFGPLAPSRLNHRLIASWTNSRLAGGLGHRLVFVGQANDPDYGNRLQELIDASGLNEAIEIAGPTSGESYRGYLSIADIAVFLTDDSSEIPDEAILDCLSAGIPTVVNSCGASAQLPGQAVVKLEQPFDDLDLTSVLEQLHDDVGRRHALSAAGLDHVATLRHPANVARMYRDAIEQFAHHHPRALEERVLREIAGIQSPARLEDQDLRGTASAIATQRSRVGQRQLLLDVSGTARYPGTTGVQRVARHLAREIIGNSPAGFRAEPIHDLDGSYTYARRFSMSLFDCKTPLRDGPIEVRSDDVFLGLDICTEAIRLERKFLESLRVRNTPMHFVVFDLLPILQPAVFPKEEPARFRAWMQTICELADGLVCISRSVADELMNWMEEEQPQRKRPLRVGFFHLGADILSRASSSALPTESDPLMAQISARPSILMVGTLEPRKGHAQALAACEQLWAEGVEANLVMVGVEGWNVKSLTDSLKNHRELGKRLFWLPRASDETLSKVYASATVLLAGSTGEGFGLPLIEGAMKNLPVIARDLPVFREVAGEHAFYFKGTSGRALSSALRTWFDLHARGLAPSSAGMRWQTWQESARQLLDVVEGRSGYREWSPKNAARAIGYRSYLQPSK